MLGLITQRQIVNQYGIKCDQLESEYIVFFENLGVELKVVSNFQEINLDNVDLLILTGGGSIYKEQSERDKLEKFLFMQSQTKTNISVIGICRGMQYINLLLGGKNTENANLNIQRPNKIDHEVKIKNNVIKVNNFHNDVIFCSDLSKKLEPLAIDFENDTVEAFYKKGILGLQWHPERKFEDLNSKKYSTELIKNFIKNRGILL